MKKRIVKEYCKRWADTTGMAKFHQAFNRVWREVRDDGLTIGAIDAMVRDEFLGGRM